MSKIHIKNVLDLLAKLCEEHNVDLGIRKIITNQVLALRDIYGDYLPKEDIINIFSKQLAITTSGYRFKPVDIEEFLLSPAYLGLEHIIRPAIKDFLIDLHRNHLECYEVVIGGGTGLGKTFATCASIAYDLYKMSCLYSPQVQYQIAPGSEIVFSFQSVKKEKALRNFNEFKAMITNSPYFNELYPPKILKDKMIFPNNIVVKVFTSTDTAAISENIFDAFIDEANWMKVVRNSKYAPEGSDIYDQATQLYLAIKDRIKNRFKDFKTGLLPGKIYLVSSANYENDFISKKEEEAKTNKHIYVFHKALWEVKPMELSGKKFWVRLPTEMNEGEILLEKPEVLDKFIIEVPIEFLDSFQENLLDSIRNISGVPIAKTIRFIPASSIEQANIAYQYIYKNRKFFKKDVLKGEYLANIESIMDIDFMLLLSKFYTFHMHIDMAIAGDRLGIAIGCVPAVVKVNYRKVIDTLTNEEVEMYDGEMPIFAFPGLLAVTSPKDGEIKIEDCLSAIFKIKKHLPTLNLITFDRAFSISLIQSLKKERIETRTISVDRTPDPYNEFRTAMTGNRVLFANNNIVKEELKYLIQDSITGKIDHDNIHSKDVCDCMAAVTYTLGKKPQAWCRDSKPKKLYLLEKLGKEVIEMDTTPRIQRVTVKRPSINRPIKE